MLAPRDMNEPVKWHPPEIERPRAHALPAAPFKVLLVEDHQPSLDAMRELLLEEGYSVAGFTRPASALEHLRDEPLPDVIVLDLHMPEHEMDGWEFRVAQKKEPTWASIPVIAISGDSSAKAEAIDAVSYLQKPLNDRAFVGAVLRVRKDLEQLRERARTSEFQRLLSLGSLLGGIAHELNNPLTFVAASIEFLRQESAQGGGLSADPRAVRALERAQLGVDRITAALRTVSTFAFADPEHVEALDIHDVLESSLQLASNELRHAASVERLYEPLPQIRASSSKLAQVFLNILMNAVHAARDDSGHKHVVRVSTWLQAEHVVVSISDTASVLSVEATQHLFDPLSAATAGRMGLQFGLAISREIVEALGGSIEVEPIQPRGAIFRVRLPCCVPEATSPLPSRAPLPRASTNRATIVVVDDDPLICELLDEILSATYSVTTFSSSRAALASLLDSSFDLVLCDIMMPELDGPELYQRLTRARPDTQERFIFMTGGAFSDRARLFLKGSARPTLPKPCRRDEVLRAVELNLRGARSVPR